VKTSDDPKVPEQYIDPEVLIALWPLKNLPAPGERAPAVALSSPGPGMIRGPFVGRGRRKAHPPAKKHAGKAADGDAGEGEGAVEASDPMPPESGGEPAATAAPAASADKPYVPVGLGAKISASGAAP
jgi:hypothetical protein